MIADMREALEAVLGPISEPLLLPGGASKEAWAVDAGGERLLVRRAGGGVIHRHTLSLHHEFEVLRAAPGTVNNFVSLALNKYFDGVPCHRIIPDFVVQCGDPTGSGTGGPGYKIPDELPKAGEYKVGSLAMANSGPNTNGSQFFIITGSQGVALAPNYSLFGQVTAGLDTTLKALDAAGTTAGVPTKEPVSMTSVTITVS